MTCPIEPFVMMESSALSNMVANIYLWLQSICNVANATKMWISNFIYFKFSFKLNYTKLG